MDRTTFKLEMRPRWVTGLVENVQEYFRREAGVEYPRAVVERSLEQWLEARFDRVLESVGEMVTSPGLAEGLEFRRILEAVSSQRSAVSSKSMPAAAVSSQQSVLSSQSRTEDARNANPRTDAVAGRQGGVGVAVGELAENRAPIFTGKRAFDAARLGAMVAYLVSRGHDIYKTNLNKLLFYSDMTAYFLRGEGISGATYVNMPFGPVPDHIEAVIETLVSNGTVQRRDVPDIGKNAVRFELGYEGADSELSDDDRQVLDWVLKTYGEMGAGELSELSHRERAYKDTRPLEPIAYEYAKFLRRLPVDPGNQ
ncbi:MAG: Panacea domain-containing protein [Pyrinomonadaceae bacterium]